MFGTLWIDVYNSMFQFPPIYSNFAQPMKRIGTTFTQTTINSLINSM
jgi:hypothetical protein